MASKRTTSGLVSLDYRKISLREFRPNPGPQFLLRVDAECGVDGAGVVADRVEAPAQVSGHLAEGKAVGKQVEDLPLRRGEAYARNDVGDPQPFGRFAIRRRKPTAFVARQLLPCVPRCRWSPETAASSSAAFPARQSKPISS